jgi:SAM-dependent methyltransferase
MPVDVQLLIDEAANANLAPSSYLTQWSEFADWQMKVLKEQGLKPEHRLLDLGCGALRLASLAIPYLKPGNYFGIDPNAPMLELGRRILARIGVDVPTNLLQSGDFDFDHFGVKFEYTMAQSVITHFSPRQIKQCIRALVPVMQPGGKLIFTYFITSYSPRIGFLFAGVEPMCMPCLKDESIFHALASELGIKFEILPDDHPSQKCGIFTF